MRSLHTPTPQAGFSLVEVMVAVLVISIGLLGVAKMQAVAMSSTGTAKMRSLGAIQAASLGSTMRADRLYWSTLNTSSFSSPFTVTMSSTGAISAPDASLNTAPANCTTLCTSAQMAALDLKNWAQSVIQTLPAATASIVCTYVTATTPVSCYVMVSWQENVVGLGTTTNTATTQAQNTAALNTIGATTYTVYVNP